MYIIDEGLDLKTKVSNQLKEIHTKQTKNLFREKDKSDRQTVEQCIDARISIIINKLKNSKQITQFDGCVSTGKEANVYYAKGTGIIDPNASSTSTPLAIKELAVKIYKTSILIFKDRERYIQGEFRFRHGYCKSNPRKMVALWAEKEVRNLKRIALSGLNVPTPYVLKSNLIVMEFIGKDGVAAPRLKDALNLFETKEDFDKVYSDIIIIMRTMFRQCRLVHADFSEYNLLYHDNKIYVIDVAQAVEHDHPNSLTFLKRDCHNINEFFAKNGIETLLDQQVYDYITKWDIKKKDLSEYVEKCREENRIKIKENTKYKEDENGLFCKFIMPRTLMEEEFEKITSNEDVELALVNLVGVAKQNQNECKCLEEDDDEDDIEGDEEDDEEDESEDDNDDDDKEGNEHEQVKDKENIKEDMEGRQIIKVKKEKYDPFKGMSKKERKQKVKIENREKRKDKMKKKEKQKLIKKTANKH